MNFRLLVSVFFFPLLLVGCNGKDSVSESPAIDTVDFTVSYVEFDDFRFIDRPLAAGDRLIFRFIPGYFFGTPVSDVLIDTPADGAGEVRITFDQSIFTEASMPQVLSVDAANAGWTVEPGDTKFGRFATFIWDSSDNFLPNRYGLYDDKSNRIFFLVYFDQAAVLSRNVQGSLSTIAEIPDKGFYAISIVESQPTDGTALNEYEVIDIENEAYFYINEE